jgi:GrpB-like predicted nucleotidyltransferase (UPF0157 family)
MCALEALTDAGLGLDYHELRLDRATQRWVAAGSSLRDQVAAILEDDAAGVEQIGSSSVVGLLAKPIIDLAVGLSEHHDLGAVRGRLEAAGWIYRGDAGDDGGHVFVLEARPWHRVAHLHVVDQTRDHGDGVLNRDAPSEPALATRITEGGRPPRTHPPSLTYG